MVRSTPSWWISRDVQYRLGRRTYICIMDYYYWHFIANHRSTIIKYEGQESIDIKVLI